MISIALLALAPLAPLDADAPEVDYAGLSKAFLERVGIGGAQPGQLDFRSLLDDAALYRRIDVGLFDVRVTRASLEDRERGEMFAECLEAVLEIQRTWHRWTAAGSEGFEAVQEDFETLGKWIGSLSGYSLASFARAEEADALVALDASDVVREAAGRLEEVMGRGAFLGLSLEPDATTQLVLVPGRGEFLETLCFTGWNDTAQRALYWKRGIEQWTSFWNGNTQVVAMEYPPFPVDWKHLERGAEMNELERTGLKQHAAEKAAASMFWRYFGTNDALFYEAALAQNLTIAAFGQNNVRTGAPVYKNGGGSTSAYEVFVPGGNASGGTLAGRGAITIVEIPLWRETKGEDHYVAPLKKAQRLGVKHARKARDPRKRDDRVHFQVHGAKSTDKDYVSAPFFGAAAAEKELPPKEFLEDYEEFFRAYRAGFFHWLRTAALGKDDEVNRKTFAELNRRLATRGEDAAFATVVEELYGAPLSDAELATEDTLESRFLTWVSKGGR